MPDIHHAPLRGELLFPTPLQDGLHDILIHAPLYGARFVLRFLLLRISISIDAIFAGSDGLQTDQTFQDPLARQEEGPAFL